MSPTARVAPPRGGWAGPPELSNGLKSVTREQNHDQHHQGYSIADNVPSPVRQFMKQLKKNKRPVVLTVKGKAGAIVQDAEAYQRLLDIAAYADAEEGIRQGLEDAKQGKVRPARQFFEDFEASRGIPR